jgi:Tfp pilus assembly protein PilV
MDRVAKRRGMALITTLIASVVLLSMGIGFLYFLERDYRFGGQQEHSQQAYYLALAGLRYQATRSDLFYPGCPNVTLPIPSTSLTNYVEIGVDSNAVITARGTIFSFTGSTFSAVLAQRTLTVESGQPNRCYQDASL